MVWVVLAMVYVLIGGFTGYLGYYMAVDRCEYRDQGHERKLGWYTYVSCEHHIVSTLGGFAWPIYGPILIGRELSRIIPNLSELRHKAKLEKIKRARRLAEEQLRVAQIDAKRKRVEARGTDEQLRGLGLLGRMGENPYDREGYG